MADFEENRQYIEQVIGYTFRDGSLLRQAFTRTTYCNEHTAPGGGTYQSNEVLEFLGDAVLSGAVATLLFESYTRRYEYGLYSELDEGDYSVIRSVLSDKKNLSASMKKLGLQRFLYMGAGDRKKNAQNEPSVAEDLFESIIGAVYLDSDGDMRVVRGVVSRMLDVREYLVRPAGAGSAKGVGSAKGALQEFCAAREHRLPPPVYELTDERTADGVPMYTYACRIGETVYGEGRGKNRTAAEAEAAAAALARLEAEYTPKKEKAAPEGDPSDSPLRRLNEYAARRGLRPWVGEVSEKPTAEGPLFTARIALGAVSATGEGYTKKDAKQAAAAALLSRLPT